MGRDIVSDSLNLPTYKHKEFFLFLIDFDDRLKDIMRGTSGPKADVRTEIFSIFGVVILGIIEYEFVRKDLED